MRGLREVEACENRNLFRNYFSKYITRIGLELKGACFIVLGDIEKAYECLRQAEADAREFAEYNESNLLELNEKMLFCENRLGLRKNTR